MIGETFWRYCLLRENGEPYNIYDNTGVYALGAVCRPDAEVYCLELAECDPDDQWDLAGWRKFGYDSDGNQDNVSLIFPSLVHLDMAMGGSCQPAIRNGVGEIVYMSVLSTEYAGRAGDL